MDDVTTHTWVAGPDSARAAARSFTRANVGRRSWVVVVLWLAVWLVMWSVLDAGLDPWARVLWALAYATVAITFGAGIGMLIARVRVRRLFAQRLAPGTELTSRFGETSIELAGPLSRHELTYDGLERVERTDGWVHLRQVGSPVSVVWPAELFPDEELDRIRAAIAGRTA